MKFIPHDYQQYAIQFLTEHPVAALLLDMGLGKTVTTLTAINELLFDRFEIRRVLVIAPLRVARDTWSAEIEKWEHLKHLKYSVAVGTSAERRQLTGKLLHIHGNQIADRSSTKHLFPLNPYYLTIGL